MDFKELLLEADRKHQEAAKKSQQIKRINTNFTTPAMKEQKSSRPKSEAVQKLLDEKKREERLKREAVERKKRDKEKPRQEREREEKRKNTFRIPKKAASEDPPSDAESFSSISSGEEPKLSSSSTAKDKTDHSVPKSSSSHADSDKSHQSSSHRHSEKKDRHSHKTYEHTSSSSHHSSKHKSGDSSSKRQESSSSKTHSSRDQDKSHGSSGSHNKTSEHKSHKNSRTDQIDKHVILKEKAIIVAENGSSGYITSPDISSEEECEELPASASKPSSAKSHAHHTNTKQNTKSKATKQRTSSTGGGQENCSAPVTLIRHHLKPTKDRTGGSLEERAKVLEKLQAIRDRMAENDPGPGRKRSAWGEVKKRRAKREKLDGDFTGSCMEKVDYEEEEKPSLKRPEPKPEEEKEKATKENKEKRRNREGVEKVKNKKQFVSEKRERKVDSKGPGKFNRFDEMHEKPKVKPKPKPRPRPPPVNFADLMKLAEQKQAEPVMVEVSAPKEKERRPLTQEELDRKQAREERLKSKDYKDWYKYGNTNSTNKKQGKPENTDSSSGGFLHPDHSVVPPESGTSQSKSFSIPRKGDKPGGAKADKHLTTSAPNHSPDSQSSVSHSVPASKSKLHPTRPGMIANKPRAMVQHMNSEEKQKSSSTSSSTSRDTTSSQPRPQSSSGARVDRTQEGNAWERLFNRPEYKKMTEVPASKKRKMVIDSEEEEDDYDEEMDDFIDDEGEDDMGTVSSMIQNMFGYDKRKYRDDDDDDRNMEVGFSEVMKEEARSARLGLQEDLEDIRKEQEELKLKAMRRKKMRK